MPCKEFGQPNEKVFPMNDATHQYSTRGMVARIPPPTRNAAAYAGTLCLPDQTEMGVEK